MDRDIAKAETVAPTVRTIALASVALMIAVLSGAELADYGRAGDWTEAAKRWCERQAIAGFPGMCRVYRASIMLMKGAWSEAEREARRACDELDGFNLSYAAEAFLIDVNSGRCEALAKQMKTEIERIIANSESYIP
jgi:hypothetical protein